MIDSTVPQVERYHAGEQLSSRKMNQAIDTLNRMTRGVDPPKQIKPERNIITEEEEDIPETSISGLWLLYSDYNSNLIIAELDIRSMRPKKDRWVFASSFLPTDIGGGPNLNVSIGGGKKFFYLANQSHKELYEYDAVTMLPIRSWALNRTGEKKLTLPIDFEPFGVTSTDTDDGSIIYIGGRLHSDPSKRRVIIIDVVGANRELVPRRSIDLNNLNIINGGTMNQQVTGIAGTADEIIISSDTFFWQIFTNDLSRARRFTGVGTNTGISLTDNRIFTSNVDTNEFAVVRERDRNSLNVIKRELLTPISSIISLG